MSLKNKIILAFLVSAIIVAFLAIFEYLNFLQIKREIKILEDSDLIRSKSLQLRRHEKNYFLFGISNKDEEVKEIYRYLMEIEQIINENKNNEGFIKLKNSVENYKSVFKEIESLVKEITYEFNISKIKGGDEILVSMAKILAIEHPLFVAELAKKYKIIPKDKNLISKLELLQNQINLLRKYGEEIITISKELDRISRHRVENLLYLSQKALFILFPLFLIVGILTLFFIAKSVITRLQLLIDLVENTGEGKFAKLKINGPFDEIGLLLKKFNEMEEKLLEREEELKRKNEELLESKKLAAIGTLAAGVAHELNNPLNNIYLSAQILKKELKDLPEYVKETVDDIMSQSIRVKHIVSDLLEFARGKEPQKKEIDLLETIYSAYNLASTIRDSSNIKFKVMTPEDKIMVLADEQQIERVFINLFSNAIDAMEHKGELRVRILKENQRIKVEIEDTGKGIPAHLLNKIFEPFYTTKEKGSGLGLAIVYSIIKKHGWDIFVESAEGIGTKFTIIIPN